MITLEAIEAQGQSFGLDELVAFANELLPRYLPEERARDERQREAVNRRLVRHLASLGLLDEPGREGREARYTARHLLQLLVVRRLQAEGHTTGAIKKLMAGADDATLHLWLRGGLTGRAGSMEPRLELHAHRTTGSFSQAAALEDDDADDAARVEPNAALAFLKPIQARAQGRSDDKSKRAPAPAPAPAIMPEASRWLRVEIEPGLEVHLRDDFRLPPTPHERDELLEQLWDKLKAAAKSKAARRTT